MIVYRKALELVRLVATVVMPVLRRRDSELAGQLHRAVRSVPLNIAEAGPQRGKRKGSHFSIALGSNREVDACLDLAVALGFVSREEVDCVYVLSDEVQAMLYVLSR